MPPITPVPMPIDKPAGNEVALYVNGSRLPSVAVTCRLTGVPTSQVCVPGFTMTGVSFTLIGVIAPVRHSMPTLSSKLPERP